MELKLFRRWGKERGMFRDNHFDNGYAAHRLFTEMFGDSTLKPYRLSTSASSRPIPPPPGRAKDPSLSRQFQQPVHVSHYLSQQCRPRFAVRPVDRRLALDAGARYLSYPWASAHSGKVVFAAAARARNSLTMPSASRL